LHRECFPRGSYRRGKIRDLSLSILGRWGDAIGSDEKKRGGKKGGKRREKSDAAPIDSTAAWPGLGASTNKEKGGEKRRGNKKLSALSPDFGEIDPTTRRKGKKKKSSERVSFFENN